MLIKSVSISLLALTAYGVHAAEQSCLPANRNISNDIIVQTGIGLTYEEAKFNLYQQLPSVGILQNLRVNTLKISTLDSYKESNILKKDINVNFDHLVTYNCKLDGKFAITTMMPRNAISYLPKQHHKEVFDEPIFKKEYSTFAYAKRVCESEIYTVIMSLNDAYEIANAAKVIEHSSEKGVHRVIVCGSFDLKTKWFANAYLSRVQSVFKNRYNMIYVGSYRSEPDVRDYSQELNLEMLKNATSE